MMFWSPDYFITRSDWRSLLDLGKMSTLTLSENYFLLSFEAEETTLPRLLVIPPASGQSSTLMADIVASFIGHAEIHVLHLLDPEAQILGSKQFGIEDQINNISMALAYLKDASERPLWCITACQASAPTLVAATRATPDALALVAAPVKPADAPGGTASMFSDGNAETLLRKVHTLTSKMRNGRRVLPSAIQMGAILQGHGGAARILSREMFSAFGPTTVFPSSRKLARQRGLVMTDGQNIDARLLLEGLRFNFIDRPFDTDNGAVSKLELPIMALAGGSDQVVPAGQCHGVDKICPNASVEHYTAEDLDHFDLFIGEDAQQKVGQKALEFFQKTAT